MKVAFLSWICNLAIVLSVELARLREDNTLVFIGSYSDSISFFSLSPEGQLTYLNSSFDDEIMNPSWLSISRSKKYVYAVNEVENFEGYSGSVGAFRFELSSLELSFINRVSSRGADPCHLSLDEDRLAIYISNYCSGTMNVVAILPDGSLGRSIQLVNHSSSDSMSCDNAHIHEVIPNERRIFATDLGLDAIFQYDLLPSGEVIRAENVQLAPLSGPRHMVIHPSSKFAFVINELSNSITSLLYLQSSLGPALNPISSVSSLPEGVSDVDMAGGEIQISADGNFIYVSNRDVSDPNQNRSCIGVFQVNSLNGTLKPIQFVSSLGIHPRHFSFAYSETLLLVANRDSNNIAVFKRNYDTGMLSEGVVQSSPFFSAPTQVLVVDM
jgi:6-phosphogluconolactonase